MAGNTAEPWDNAVFVAFVDRAFEYFLEAGATDLVIDLRQSPGGDNSFSDAMLAWIADEPFEFDIPFAQPREDRRFTGRAYALINRHSYSNAVNVAAMIQDYGLGVVAGEKTADMATTYGAMETFRLPATGIEVGFPKAHIIRPSGETRPDGVTPDWPMPSPIVAGAEDTVLEALLARIRQGGYRVE
ncbi:MAG: S41 family peptidase [Woeseiaceae bacterium]